MEQRVSLVPAEQGLSPSEPATARRDSVAAASSVNFESTTRQIAQRQALAKLQGSPRVNDDPRLEHEADTMGSIASRGGVSQLAPTSPVPNDSITGAGVVQRAVGFELEVDIPVSQQTAPADTMPAGFRPAGQDWANARIPFPEADPHGIPPVPQAVIYTATNGGVTVDAVPDKRLLAAGMPRQILEIRVSPIDTANIAGLGATMGHVRTGIDGLYNPINGVVTAIHHLNN